MELQTRFTFGLLTLSTLQLAAQAQGLAAAYVCDTTGDSVWFCQDLDGNGDYNGVAEANVFYDDTLGAVPLSNNSGIWRSDDGAVWVSDSTEDIILRLVDTDNDGVAHSAGEATIWFDGRTGGNLSGVDLTSSRGMWRDPNGVLWVASANVVSGGNDAIVRLEDLNNDGDANDLGEAREYFTIAPGGATGASIPTAIVRGADGALYYAENGTGSSPLKGAYRLEDLDNSGYIDQPNEVTPFFIAPAQGGTAFHWEITIDAQGAIYLGDTGNDVLWRLVDTNMDGVIDPVTEASLYWVAGAASNVWDIDVAPDGSLYLAEDQTPDRIVRLVDVNGDGSIDPVTEAFTVYDDTVSANDIASPRAIALVKPSSTIGVAYCGPAVANSSGSSAAMSASGSADVASNNLVLTAEGLPQNAFGFFLTSTTQGLLLNPGGSQGNLCLAGSIGRFVGAGQIQNSGAAGLISLALDLTQQPTPTGLVAVLPGQTWNFTAWFRDTIGGNATSNFADALEIQFQ
ncbi:MAG: hypothetical protein R3F49_14155 [Planctomycetota bacterium]